MTEIEEALLDMQQNYKFIALNNENQTDTLFAYSIFKSFLSSPQAALASIRNRMEKATVEDENLRDIQEKLEEIINLGNDSRYTALKNQLAALKWKGNDAKREKDAAAAEKAEAKVAEEQKAAAEQAAAEQAAATEEATTEAK